MITVEFDRHTPLSSLYIGVNIYIYLYENKGACQALPQAGRAVAVGPKWGAFCFELAFTIDITKEGYEILGYGYGDT